MRGEAGGTRAIVLPAATAAVLLSQQIGAKAARDAFFLASRPASELPRVMASAAIVSLVVVLGTSRLITRFGPARVMPVVLGINAAALLLLAILAPIDPPATALALFFLVAATGSITVSGFWSLVTERFDPHRARQMVGRIGAGATLGGAFGGIAADVVARLTSARGLLVELALASAIGALLVVRLSRREVGAPRSVRLSPADLASSPLSILKSTPYLQALGGLAALAAVWASLLDFSFKTGVANDYRSQEDLVRFFGWFYTAVGVLTFGAQTLLGDRLVRNKGIGVAVLVLPTFVAVGGVVAGAVDALALLVVLRAGESILVNSLHRSSYELFFTPLSPATKRPTKMIVDVAATRVGDAVGGLITTAALALLPHAPSRGFVLGAALAAIAALGIATRLGKGYVKALADALRGGRVDIGQADEVDALTRITLVESTTAIDRDRLLTEIEAYRREMMSGDGDALKKRTLGGGRPSLEMKAIPIPDARLDAMSDLLSNDVERMRRVLGGTVDAALGPFVVELLVHKKLANDAEKALVELGPRVAGMLTDTLVAKSKPTNLRARAARVLGAIAGPRAIAGLIEGLDAEAHAVRLACARALARIARQHSDEAPSREVVFAAVAQALERPNDPLDLGATSPPTSGSSDGVFGEAETSALRLEQGVHVALTLLACVLEVEAVELVVRAIAGSDSKLRGTALEYLENVVPDPARRVLTQKLVHAQTSGKRRTQRELLEDLGRSKG
ncbi:MAG: Npt1/Npt2 family nucleotide transporter [Polyangiaceae bacterium]